MSAHTRAVSCMAATHHWFRCRVLKGCKACRLCNAGRLCNVVGRGLTDENEADDDFKAEHLQDLVQGRRVAYAEEFILPWLGAAAKATLCQLSAQTAQSLAWARLQAGPDDLATLDANYVRDEQAIYRRTNVGELRG